MPRNVPTKCMVEGSETAKDMVCSEHQWPPIVHTPAGLPRMEIFGASPPQVLVLQRFECEKRCKIPSHRDSGARDLTQKDPNVPKLHV